MRSSRVADVVSPSAVLSTRVSAAIESAFGPELRGTDPVLRPSQHADIQVNAALALAKRLGMPPREVAARVVEHLDVDAICSAVEVSGPGFVNLTLDDRWIEQQVDAVRADPRLGVSRSRSRQVVTIDYSAPNVAKEMHVGHLRTTVVGDALARTLEHLGHQVIRQNHIGDWGTPFGMLIEHLLDVGEASPEARVVETDPNAFYQAARQEFDQDPVFAHRARARVVALQAGDPETLRLWQELVDLSRLYFNTVYSRLGVTLTDDDLAGESTYNDDLAAICDDLEAVGLATVSEGALCVFLDGFTGREGKPVPLIIRKSDGGYGYGTTDLATVRHRVRDLRADRLVYVIGAPQSLHLDMVWETARLAGWLPPDVAPVHVKIGNVLGEDRKILKTRSGAPLRLLALLDEAEATARAVIDKARARPRRDRPRGHRTAGRHRGREVRRPLRGPRQRVRLRPRPDGRAQRQHRPYLQYAAARIRSIFRNAGLDPDSATAPITLLEPAERALALDLLELGTVVEQVGDRLEPHRLCGYLFDLAQAFSAFYEHCPVLKAEPAVRDARLALCALTLRALVTGLDLLGIEAPERM